MKWCKDYYLCHLTVSTKNKTGGEEKEEEEEITYVVQVSKHGIKTWNRIHVNVVPRFMNKPKTAEIRIQDPCPGGNERCDTNQWSCGNWWPAEWVINSLVANDAAGQQQLMVVPVLGSGCLGRTLAKALYNRIGMQAFIWVSEKRYEEPSLWLVISTPLGETATTCQLWAWHQRH